MTKVILKYDNANANVSGYVLNAISRIVFPKNIGRNIEVQIKNNRQVAAVRKATVTRKATVKKATAIRKATVIKKATAIRKATVK